MGQLIPERGTMDLSGQTAIVTGAGRGLGRAFALALASAGAHVVLTARSEPELLEAANDIRQAGGAATPIATDVTDRAAVEGLVARVEQQVGPIDLLINNAGVFRALGLISEVDPDEWWREVEINLRGPHLYLRAVLPYMIQRRRGRILNIASGAGLGGTEAASAYGTSKAALIRLSETAALENQAHGIAIFAVDPGTVRTPMTDFVEQSPEVGRRAPRVQQFFKDAYAHNHLSPIEAAVALILQLASGHADALSGCFLRVQDDLPALIQQAEVIQQAGRLKLRLNA
jgi:NAD(P)-dependent dehydrogenase (short-subunit alcohol dehydrogenase family)